METTVKIYKKDAVVLRQLQDYFDLKEKSFTQPDFLHEMLTYLLKHQQNFMQEMETHQQMHQQIMGKWMKVLMERMKEEDF